MDELQKWITDSGFQLEAFQPDGKVYRFDRDGKKNAWLWAVRLYTTKTGEEYIIAQGGDWKTDEEFSFRPNKHLSSPDRKIIQANIKESMAKAEKAKEALHYDAKEMAAQILSGARMPGPTEYMKRKMIPELFGARVINQSSIDHYTGRKSHGSNGEVLVVPMRSSGGQLWGLQQITDSTRGNNKYFIVGQRIEGCFHLIPEDADLNGPDPIFICEGFATGVSIHLATQGVVAVSFNAGNLSAVAKAIRSDHQDKPIIVCGDDDVWSRRPDGSPYNAGRDKAPDAAKAVMGRVVFPKFRSEDGKPTDFNDLHIKEGIEAVREQLLEVKPERHYVKCLGHKDGSYFYTSSSNKEIVSISNHSSDSLTNLMPVAYWNTLYPSKTGTDWLRAADDLKTKCRERGIFNPDNIRGLGVWLDEDRTVVHLGDRLSVDGEEIGIHDIHSNYIYQLDQRARSIHPEPLTLDECQVITHLMDLLVLERPEQKFFLAGWLMAAKLSGILEWRPQMWVTGESGSGKSVVLKQFIYPMLGEQRKRFTGGSTEAGMRQTIGANAVPVLYDEFEPDSHEAVIKVKACIDFIRQASTDSGSIVKGSMGGASMQFKTRFCAVVSAIRTLLNNQADRSRFTLVELKKVHNDPEQWNRVKRVLKAFTPEYADRYFARILNMLPVIQANQKKFESAFAEKHSQRFGQQYAPLMAGWSMLISDQALSDEKIQELVDSVDLTQEGAASTETDQDDCLNHLLHRKVSLTISDTRHDVTVATALSEARTNERWNHELQIYGIKYVNSPRIPGGEGFFVASRNPQLSGLFRDTSWEAGWTNSLSRLPMARRNTVAKLSGFAVKGVMLSVSGVLGQEIQDSLRI